MAIRPVPIAVFVTLPGSLLLRACDAHGEIRAGAARIAPIESTEPNQIDGIVPHWVDGLTCESTHNIPMLHTIG
jgi:hypothetical protein